MGFVLIMLITFRLGLIHTRLNGLRAANSNLPVGAVSVASLSLPFSCLCSVLAPCQSPSVKRRVRMALRGMFRFSVFRFLFSSLSASCLP